MKRDRLKDVIDGALSAQIFSHIGMVIGTAFFVNKAAFEKIINEGYNAEMAAMVSPVIALIVAIVMDGALKKQLPYIVAWLSGKSDKKTGVERLKWFNIVILLICVIQFSLSMSFNFASSGEIVTSAMEDVDISDYNDMTSTATDRYSMELNIIQDKRNESRDKYNDLVNNRTSIEAEIIGRKTNSEYARLYKKPQNRDWVKTQIKGTVNRAVRQVQKDIDAAKAEMNLQEERLSSFMASSGGAVDSVQIATTSLMTSDKLSHSSKKNSWTLLIQLLFAGLGLVFVLSTIVVVVYEESEDEDLSKRATFGNILKGMATRSIAWVQATLVKLFRLDKFVVIPVLANDSIHAPTLTVKEWNSGHNEKSESKVRKSESQEKHTEKVKCKSGKCKPKSESQNSVSEKINQLSESQKTTQKQHLRDTEPTQNIKMTAFNSDGVEWPTPTNKAEFTSLCKRARGWSKQAFENQNKKTRDENLKRWNVFQDFAISHGRRAGRNKDTGKCFCTKTPEPTIISDENIEWDLSNKNHGTKLIAA